VQAARTTLLRYKTLCENTQTQMQNGLTSTRLTAATFLHECQNLGQSKQGGCPSHVGCEGWQAIQFQRESVCVCLFVAIDARLNTPTGRARGGVARRNWRPQSALSDGIMTRDKSWKEACRWCGGCRSTAPLVGRAGRSVCVCFCHLLRAGNQMCWRAANEQRMCRCNGDARRDRECPQMICCGCACPVPLQPNRPA
jgi:hypothetical protein